MISTSNLVDKSIDTQKNQSIYSYIIILVFFLLPIYYFPSGSYQFVDIPIYLLFLTIIFTFHNQEPINRIVLYYLPFNIYVIFINGLYFIIFKDVWFFKTTIGVVNGFMVFFIFSVIFGKIKIDKNIIYIYIALLFSIIGVFVTKGEYEGNRTAFSFNNPNQLGFFALTLICYIILLRNFIKEQKIAKKIYTFFDVIILLFAHYFIAMSMSRATIAAAAILDVCLLKNILKDIKSILFILLNVFIILFYLFYINPNFLKERIATRDQTKLTYDGMKYSMESRVLTPFKSWKGVYIIFGYGAGALSRDSESGPLGAFKRQEHIEVHNIFGDVLKAYGLIGLSLFCFWISNFIWQSKIIKDGFWIWSALIIFNLAGNRIRFRPFWILLAFIVILINEKTAKKINSNK